MVFSKKWLRNHQKFLLHFLIHIDVLMLCSKFELIPTNIFRVSHKLKSTKYSVPLLHHRDFGPILEQLLKFVKNPIVIEMSSNLLHNNRICICIRKHF